MTPFDLHARRECAGALLRCIGASTSGLPKDAWVAALQWLTVNPRSPLVRAVLLDCLRAEASTVGRDADFLRRFREFRQVAGDCQPEVCGLLARHAEAGQASRGLTALWSRGTCPVAARIRRFTSQPPIGGHFGPSVAWQPVPWSKLGMFHGRRRGS